MKLKVTLQQKLALPAFVCRAFGSETPRDLLHELAQRAGRDGSLLPDDRLDAVRQPYGLDLAVLEAYDRNLQRHEGRLRLTPEHGRGLKPHQYLALLFTEYYLDRYFTDPAELLADLNKHLRTAHRELPPYTRSDLETLAFQSATGSGKTLLMHVHIEQYRCYARQAGRRVGATILLTPNERMSEQHLREFRASRMRARLFTPDASSDLFRPVEIFRREQAGREEGNQTDRRQRVWKRQLGACG